MTITVASPHTLEAFLKLPFIDESPAWEFIDGESRQKPMGGRCHSTLQKRLVSIIDQVSGDFEAFLELRCTVAGRSGVGGRAKELFPIGI